MKWTDANDLSPTRSPAATATSGQQNKILTDQLNLRADFSTGFVEHNLSTGLELIREQQFAHTVVGTGTRPPANLYNPDWNDTSSYAWARNGAGSDGQTDTTALYAFDTLKFGDHFLLTAGLRADHFKTQYVSRALCNNTTGNNAVPCNGQALGSLVQNNDLQVSDTLVNWKIGGVYKPLESLSVYANYALSQQPPGGANFQLSTAASNANNPDLDPQKAKTIELGSKWSLLDEKVALNLALFRTRVSNEIMPDPVTPTIFIQTGEKTVKASSCPWPAISPGTGWPPSATAIWIPRSRWVRLSPRMARRT